MAGPGTADLLEPLSNPGKAGLVSPQEAIEVSHPALQVYRITALYLLELGVPEPGPAPGVRTIALKFVEFRPQRGGSYNAPTRAETDLPSKINHSSDYAGTTNPPAPPSATQTGP